MIIPHGGVYTSLATGAPVLPRIPFRHLRLVIRTERLLQSAARRAFVALSVVAGAVWYVLSTAALGPVAWLGASVVAVGAGLAAGVAWLVSGE